MSIICNIIISLYHNLVSWVFTRTSIKKQFTSNYLGFLVVEETINEIAAGGQPSSCLAAWVKQPASWGCLKDHHVM